MVLWNWHWLLMRMVLWNWHLFHMRNYNHENGLVKLTLHLLHMRNYNMRNGLVKFSHKYVMCLQWKFCRQKKLISFLMHHEKNMRYTHIRIVFLPWQWNLSVFSCIMRYKNSIVIWWICMKYGTFVFVFHQSATLDLCQKCISHIHDTHVHEYISFASCLCTTHIIIQQKTYT